MDSRLLYQAILCILIVLIFSSAAIYGQGIQNQTRGRLQSAGDSIHRSDPGSLHKSIDAKFDALEDSTHIEAELEIDNKSIYVGRSYGGNGLLYDPKFVFYHKSGFGFSILNYSWAISPTVSSITDLIINYDHSVNDNFDFGFDYDYWIFNKDFPKKLGWNNLIDAKGSYSIKDWINANSDITYMFGSQRGLLFHESIGLNINAYPFSNYQRISFKPEAGIYIGNPSIYKKKVRPGTELILSSKFGVLDYYALLKLVYQYKQMSFGLSYQNDFPQKYKNKTGSSITQSSYFSFIVKRYFMLKSKS